MERLSPNTPNIEDMPVLWRRDIDDDMWLVQEKVFDNEDHQYFDVYAVPGLSTEYVKVASEIDE